MTEGTVLHADLDAFYASVEQRDDPSLRGRPVIVGGGVVLAASYEAKARGVRTAMGGRQALRLCPEAVVVPARFSAYTKASRAVFDVFHDTTPLVEGISIDEAFLEVGGLRRIRGEPSAIATRLRADVRDKVGLPISVGVARTKYLAKVASAVSKPEGLLVVPVEHELEFLHALPVERLWGVGKVTAGKLREARIHTVGDVAEMFEVELVQLLGPGAGRHLHALAHNRDPRPVQTGKRRGSMGAQHAMGRGDHSPAELDLTLLTLVDRVTRRMRAAGRTGSTVTIRLRFGDFTRSTSSHTLSRPTAHHQTVLETARMLLQSRAGVIREKGLTLVGVSVGALDDNPLSWRCHSTPRAGPRSTPSSTRCVTSTARRPCGEPCSSAATTTPPSRCSPTDPREPTGPGDRLPGGPIFLRLRCPGCRNAVRSVSPRPDLSAFTPPQLRQRRKIGLP